MKPLLTCREAASLLTRTQDVPLTWGQRATLRLHLLMCTACTRFSKQVDLMGRAMGPWRAYKNDDKSSA